MREIRRRAGLVGALPDVECALNKAIVRLRAHCGNRMVEQAILEYEAAMEKEIVVSPD